MTVKLSTTINNIERDVVNSENKQLLVQFFDFMKRAGTSEKYPRPGTINNLISVLIAYAKKNPQLTVSKNDDNLVQEILERVIIVFF